MKYVFTTEVEIPDNFFSSRLSDFNKALWEEAGNPVTVEIFEKEVLDCIQTSIHDGITGCKIPGLTTTTNREIEHHAVDAVLQPTCCPKHSKAWEERNSGASAGL